MSNPAKIYRDGVLVACVNLPVTVTWTPRDYAEARNSSGQPLHIRDILPEVLEQIEARRAEVMR
jgi:hypothetical protein